MKWNLICFDQAHNIKRYKEILSERYLVTGCQDPLEYQEVLQSNSAHAILIGANMSDLFQKITSDPVYYDFPVILVSKNVAGDELQEQLSGKIKSFQKTASKLQVGNLMMDFDSFKVMVDDQQAELTMIEMKVLAAALRNIPEGMAMEKLLKTVWGLAKVKPGTVNTHVTWIKSKLSNWTHELYISNDKVLIDGKSLI